MCLKQIVIGTTITHKRMRFRKISTTNTFAWICVYFMTELRLIKSANSFYFTHTITHTHITQNKVASKRTSHTRYKKKEQQWMWLWTIAEKYSHRNIHYILYTLLKKTESEKNGFISDDYRCWSNSEHGYRVYCNRTLARAHKRTNGPMKAWQEGEREKMGAKVDCSLARICDVKRNCLHYSAIDVCFCVYIHLFCSSWCLAVSMPYPLTLLCSHIYAYTTVCITNTHANCSKYINRNTYTYTYTYEHRVVLCALRTWKEKKSKRRKEAQRKTVWQAICTKCTLHNFFGH